MKHPQDLLEITFKERLLIWWLKFYAYWIGVVHMIVWRVPVSSRIVPSNDKKPSRSFENKLFLKLIRGQETASPTPDSISFGCVVFVIRTHDSISIEDKQYVAKMWVNDPQNENLHLVQTKAVKIRWWLERIILKEYKRIQNEKAKRAAGFEAEIDDIILKFHTKDL